MLEAWDGRCGSKLVNQIAEGGGIQNAHISGKAAVSVWPAALKTACTPYSLRPPQNHQTQWQAQRV